MPTGQALRLCPDATVVSVPRGAVSQRSRTVREALHALAPVVEVASVDEFYLDLTGTERLFKETDLTATAKRIRLAVLDRTDIETSVGGGPNRLVAKLATSRAKPAGVHVVPPEGVRAFMETLSLEAIPGIGPALLEQLHRRGLRTVRQTLEVDEEWLTRWLGAHRGAWLYARVRGRGSDDVDPSRERKSISTERTFHEDLDDDGALEAWLSRLVDSVGSTLRKQELRARTVTVKIKDADFRARSRAQTLPEPVESDRAIREAARPLLEDLRKQRRVPARLLGVGVAVWKAPTRRASLACSKRVPRPARPSGSGSSPGPWIRCVTVSGETPSPPRGTPVPARRKEPRMGIDPASPSIAELWPRKPVLLGMVHLQPLPGAPRWGGDMTLVIERALADADALEAAGFDGMVVENYLDAPFHPGRVPAVTVAALTRVVAAVVERVSVPVGVNVLRNDAGAALAIAAVTGARFIRVNVHTGAMWTDQGLLTGQAHETLRSRRLLDADVAILADVHVKHAVPPAGTPLAQAAADAWHRGMADGLVVTGSGTGLETSASDVRAVADAVPGAPVFIGSGVTRAAVASLPPGAHGAIVGSLRDARWPGR